MQKVQVIDITKSYLPGDPNSVMMNLISTDREDGEEKSLPVIPMEGYNFLPTPYGYRSYFGISSTLTGDTVPANCDQVILFQTDQYENMMIAFCAAGIYTRSGVATTWTQSFPLTDDWTATSTYREYTWCVIENDLYIYRQGHTHVLKVNYDGTFTSFVPSFLNMAGQMGLFRANGRLGFWDSLNSVSWSSAFDLTDFTPALETMVGSSIFLGVQGRIVTIKNHGEGYIIYATKSIVGVSYVTSGTTLWDGMTLTSAGGIGYPKAVTTGATDKEHFVYTSIGIFMIGHFNALSRQYDMQQIAPELYDFLKENRTPVYLDCFGGRYLHFGLLNPDYITGITSFTENSILPAITISSLDTLAEALAKPYSLERDSADPDYPMDGTFQGRECIIWGSASGAITTLGYPAQFAVDRASWNATAWDISFDFNIIANPVVGAPQSIVIFDQLAYDTVGAVLVGFSIQLYFGPGDVADLYVVYGAQSHRFDLNTFPDDYFNLWNTYKIKKRGASVALEINGIEYAWTSGSIVLPAIMMDDLTNETTLIRNNLSQLVINTDIFGITNLIFDVPNPAPFYDFPPVSFSLQDGVPVPAYAEIFGSLVFDLQLKKWGKFAGSHLCLISLSPLNETSNQAIPYTNFGIDSGILSYADNSIKLFSPEVVDSSLKYGKIGFLRQGFTNALEVVLQFRIFSTGTVTIEGSLDGKTIDPRFTTTSTFTDAVEHTAYIDKSCRWFTIEISGQFDLTYLEFRGSIAGRR